MSATGPSIGTPHPILVEAVAPDGAWLAICQARADTDGDGEIAAFALRHGGTGGDLMLPYLVRGHGDGEPIERFLQHSKDGRWIVAVRGGELGLLDTRTWRWTTLAGADQRDGQHPLERHRAVSLAAAGNHAAYLRGDDTIVVRSLANGAEHAVRLAGALIWRVDIDDAGHWAQIQAVRRDTDRDGKLTWPSLATNLSRGGCSAPASSFTIGGARGDAPDTLWLHLETGDVIDEGDVVLGAAGEQLVRAPADGSLRLGDTIVADPSCRAQVLAIATAPPRVLFTCQPPRSDKARVEIAGLDPRKQTAVTVTRDGRWRSFVEEVRDDRWCDDDGHCVELATGAETVPRSTDDDALPDAGEDVRVYQVDRHGRRLVGPESPERIANGPLRWLPETKQAQP